ncbi:flagellar FliJ family protein [Ferrimonas futtsuensis]|uniref:flagellar FliJ family protein n=1 Tax=Ferrimonas futtsuensis TaxID=364764 RepID=UPI000402CCFF|nr:flagellar FliJ family protein [Ferrimonas futtsuensis]
MVRKIQLLREKQEQQMAQLGQQKQRSQLRLAQLERRRQGLEQALAASGVAPEGGNVLSWQNRSHYRGQLIPATQKLALEQGLAEQEQGRISRLWQHALARRQGLAWLEEQRHQQGLARRSRTEQRQQDEAGGRMACSARGVRR